MMNERTGKIMSEGSQHHWPPMLGCLVLGPCHAVTHILCVVPLRGRQSKIILSVMTHSFEERNGRCLALEPQEGLMELHSQIRTSSRNKHITQLLEGCAHFKNC